MLRFDYPVWIDPVIFSLGPVQLTWYALAYMGGLIVGWQIIRRRVVADRFGLSPTDIDDLVLYILLGVILGGRVGNFLFGWGQGDFWTQVQDLFWPFQTLSDGRRVIAITGMSFHGGFLGVVVAAVLFWLRKRRNFALMGLADYLALTAPIGLFLGRIANFINRELYGRVVGDQAWVGVNFYPAGNPPYFQTQLEACLGAVTHTLAQCREFYDLTAYRHPSQLYEAAGEGLVLFLVLLVLYRRAWVRARVGLITGAFLVGYGLVRTLVEFVRSYEPTVGLDAWGLSRSQELSVPMVLIGALLILWVLRRHRHG